MSRIKLRLFGRFELLVNGQPATDKLQYNSARALLSYLAVERGTHSRSAVAGLLWPDSSEAEARNSLRQTLFRISKLLGKESVQTTRQTIALSPACSIDVTELENALTQHEETQSLSHLTTLPALYAAPFLDQSIPWESILYQEWVLLVRERIHRRVMAAFDQLIDHKIATADWSTAQTYATQQLDLDGWREHTHRQLMTVQWRQGHHSEAIAQFERCRQLLADELGVEPSGETVALLEEIKEDKKGRRGRLGEVKKHLSPTSSTLPLPPTPLIGRKQLLATILDRLHDDDCRLLTLVGAGGMGKTRLAIAAGHAMMDERSVRWVDLSGLASGESQTAIETMMVEALGVDLLPQPEPLQQIIVALNQHPTLLIVDNLEQVLEHAQMLSELIQHVSSLKLLATSRERLNLTGEWLIEVAGLPVDEAQQLFVAAAGRIRPNFTPTEHSDAIVQLCHQVGGMPLALELTASWLRSLDPADIVSELAQSIDIVSTRSRDLPERHRSLAAVFDYSWSTLAEAEQRALLYLAVCRGGFDRAAAQALGAASLPILSGLIDKSLLRRRPNGRYVQHEAVRQYALSRLTPNEQQQAASKHAHYFADWLEAANGEMSAHSTGPSINSGGALVQAELANLQAGWRWSVRNDVGLALRYIEPLNAYYERENLTVETIDLFTVALDSQLTNQVGNVTRASWRRRLGEANFRLGHMTICRDSHKAALADLNMPLPSNKVALTIAMGRQMAQQVAHRRRLPEPSAEGQAAKLEAIRLFERLGQVYFFENDSLTAGYTALKGLNLAETIPVSAELARLYANTCMAVGMMPQPKLATIYQQAALNTIDQLDDDPATVAWVLEVLSIYNSGIANWQQVIDWIDEALLAADRDNDQRRRDECLVMHATTARYTGDLRRCYAIWEDMYNAAKARADRQVQTWGLGGMLDMLVRMDNVQPHWALFEESLGAKDQRDDNDNISMLSAHGLAALVYSQQGDDAQAFAEAKKGVALMVSGTPTSYSALDSYEDISESCFMLYEREPNHFAEGLSLGQQANTAFKKFANAFPIGKPGVALCIGWEKWLTGKQKAALAIWERGIKEAQTLGMPLEEAKLHAIIGRSHPDTHAHHTQAADDLFNRCAAAGEHARWLSTL